MLSRPYGPSAWLIEDVADPIAWAAGLQLLAHAAVTDIVPAKHTVLVHCERSAHTEVGQLFNGVIPAKVRDSRRQVEIDVIYDGEDLVSVAEQVGMSTGEVVERHQAGHYRVQFCGFSPGFAYLGGIDPQLQIPRRDNPRTRVPAGSVAIAADYGCIYPSPSPGGWHLLGHTTADIWNVDRPEPALLMPGTPVRFKRVG